MTPRTRRKRIPGEGPSFRIAAGDNPNRRVEAHSFTKNHAVVGQRFQVGYIRRPSLQHSSQFGMEPLFGFWMLRQEIPGPGKRVRGGFMPGHQHGQSFIANLFVRESCVSGFLVADTEEREKQIVARAFSARRSRIIR